jgi:TldD protein
MTVTRRAFLRDSSMAAVAAAAGVGQNRLPGFVARYLDVSTGDPDPALQALASQALDAAKAAGASYADIRFSLIEGRRIGVDGRASVNFPYTQLDAATSVRALVNGRWGFVAGIVWSTDEVVRLARAAVAQAKAVAWAGAGDTLVELAPAAAVTGQWRTPIERDPLEVPAPEIVSDIIDVHRVAYAVGGEALADVKTSVGALRADKTFASTDGSFVQQRLYTMFSTYSNSYVKVRSADVASASAVALPGVWPTAGGYELFAALKLKEQMPAAIERALRGLNTQPGDVGRFDIVLDARSVANLVAKTVGRATQLDRALGNEANSQGSSFLAPPEAVLGTMRLGSPALTITADRTSPHGAATTAWDDEGVAAEAFSLIDRGLLVDYQTGREEAATLGAYYGTQGRPVRSHGCGGADSAHHVVLTQMPNLVVHPGTGGDVEALMHGIVDGYVFFGTEVDVDQQSLDGQGYYSEQVHRIRKGKLAEPVERMSFLFQTPTLWKAIGGQALGSPESAVTVGMYDYKGQPYQDVMFSVTAVPMRLANMRVASLGRRL